jgi:hypothetical protein
MDGWNAEFIRRVPSDGNDSRNEFRARTSKNPFLDSLGGAFIIRAPVGFVPFEIENEK